MKKQIIILVALFLSINSFSQHTGNQGNSGNENDNSVGRGTAIEPYMLTGREAIKKPIPQTDNCKEYGRVIMEVVVDKKGNVLEAKLGRGSTTYSLCLVEASKKAALKTKWNKDENALEKQNGKIIYYFKRE